MPLKEIFKIEHSETPFPAFLRAVVKKKKENKKNPKYWYQVPDVE